MKRKTPTLDEQLEKITAMGQEDEVKAAKWVLEEEEKNAHEINEEETQAEWKLSDSRKTPNTYSEKLLEEAKRQVTGCDIPRGYGLDVVKTKKGLLFGYKTTEGKWFMKGMKISMVPKYDLQAVTRLLFAALDAIEGHQRDKRSPGGIILPS